MKNYYLFLLLLLSSLSLSAQCNFDPLIEGDILFCPNQTEGELTCNLQSANAYQWLSRPFNGGSATIIPGATNSSLSITNNDILTYFSVDVTIDGCTERSPEVLIDQLLFLLPAVETTGDYVYDGSAFLICDGDSMFMTLMPPYDTNIIWYKDGSPIPGETEPTLEVSEPGVYTVSGAPSDCPDYIQFLGLDLFVLFNTDPNVCDILEIDEQEWMKDVVVYPNPASEVINITSRVPIHSVEVKNVLGQQLYYSNVDALETSIDVTNFARGAYFAIIRFGMGTITKKIIKE